MPRSTRKVPFSQSTSAHLNASASLMRRPKQTHWTISFPVLAPSSFAVDDVLIREEPIHIMIARSGGRTVIRLLSELRVHPALAEIGFCGFLSEVSDADRSQDQMSAEEPIFVTLTGVILSG